MSGGSGSARSGKKDSLPDPLADTRLAEIEENPDAFDTDRVAPSLPTALFERYKIKRKLGAGGMGVVYEAVDLNLHRVVALKVLKLVDEDPQQVADAANRLVREARAMAVLSHKNVVTVYDVGMHGMQVYVAMQLVEGTTLRHWLAGGPRSVSQTLRVLCEAGAGLAAAHRARIIHRDFKPDNVLVSKSGSVRVTDFGLARRANFDHEPTTPHSRTSRPKVLDVHSVESVTKSGAILGTPAYMPPEQSEGRECDARADQFSFCVTAWEALYGVRPFEGKNWSELYTNVVAGNIREPDGKSRVPRTIQKALRRGMSVEPGDRFASMSELLDILETGLQRERAWLRYLVVPLASAAAAAAIAFFITRDTSKQAPAPVASAPAANVTVEPIVTPAPEAPVAPGSAAALAPDATPEPTPAIGKKKHHTDSHKKSGTGAHVETAAETPASPAVEQPAPKQVDPADAVRARRKEIEAAMRERGLRIGDLPAAASSAFADAEAALAASDVAVAQKALGEAEHAIAGIVIDYAFINSKLARLNKRLEQSKGREEEFRALYVQLKGLVQAKDFTKANALLNDMADRLSKK